MFGPRRWFALPCGLLVCVVSAGGGQVQGVLTDGSFAEWRDVAPVLQDPSDAPPDAAVDLGAVQVLDDGQFIHLTVEVGRTVNAQAMHGTVSMLFDADGDSATGGEVHGLSGVDLILDLSQTEQPQPGGYGAGIGVRSVTGDGIDDMQWGYVVGAVAAPTHSASKFEIRMRRGVSIGGAPLFVGTQTRFRLVFSDPLGVRDETATASYAFRSAALAVPGGSQTMSLEPTSNSFRVLVWNVSSDNFRDRPDPFRRVLAALNPDVVLLDEVYGDVTSADLAAFFATAPLGSLGDWEFVLGRSGGRQKTVVATRRPIQPEERLLDVPYSDGDIDRLESSANDPRFARLFQLERGRGLATAGAWIEVSGREVLFVPIDLQSAGYDGSVQDRLRQLQATTLNERIADVLRRSAGSRSVVVAGDLNLVGSVDPLNLLIDGLDGNGDLAVARAYRLTDRSQATWRNEDVAFTPGRLDFVLYTGSTLEAERAFVFDVSELSAETMAGLGLEPDDSRTTSDHLPVIVDYLLLGR